MLLFFFFPNIYYLKKNVLPFEYNLIDIFDYLIIFVCEIRIGKIRIFPSNN